MRPNRRRVLLLQPPYGDYTYPYHSLSYVSAPLKAAGYEVDVIDLGTLWFRHIFQASQVAAWNRELSAIADAMQRRPFLTIAEQMQLVSALQCMAACAALDPESAVGVLRSPEFYNFSSYLWARSQVRAFERVLSELYAPYDFFSAFAVPPYEADCRRLVARAIAQRRLIADLFGLLEERCRGREYLFCGVTFPFSTHLMPGIAAFRALRELFPDTPLVAGGTALTDIYKYKQSSEALHPFREVCDFFYIGEAETGLTQFAEWIRGCAPACPPAAVNLKGGCLEGVGCGPEQYISLSDRHDRRFQPYSWAPAPPDYTWIDWSLYLSPEKRVNYAPARGCFWNQCTFCDYGLNADAPTAPSRTMDVATCVSHLQLLEQAGIDRVYLAVDAIPPKFLQSFTEELLRRQLPIGWSTQFFLTRQFTPELVSSMESSGLRVASFGLESGSNRILEQMGKGKNRVTEDLLPALRSFQASGIGLQPLFFYGFPGETSAERQLTIDFLLTHSDVFSTISKGGRFSLLSGSIAARQPEKFGIRNVRRRPDEDISGEFEYEMASDEPPLSRECMAKSNSQLPHFRLWERPWAGGIDTLHTQLYVERYGRGVFHELQQQYRAFEEPWGSICVSAAFELEDILQNTILYRELQCETAANLARCCAGVTDAAIERIFQPIPRRNEGAEFTLRLRLYHEI